MIPTLLQLVFVLLIAGVLWWALQQLLPLIPLPDPIRTVVYVLLVVIFALVLIYLLMGLADGIGGLRLRI